MRCYDHLVDYSIDDILEEQIFGSPLCMESLINCIKICDNDVFFRHQFEKSILHPGASEIRGFCAIFDKGDCLEDVLSTYPYMYVMEGRGHYCLYP
jgi:hypothetical protein